MKKWIKGDPACQAACDGKTCLLANSQGKKMFDVPRQVRTHPRRRLRGGVAPVKMGKRVPADIRHAAFHDERLYLFSNDEVRKMSRAQPIACQRLQCTDSSGHSAGLSDQQYP